MVWKRSWCVCISLMARLLCGSLCTDPLPASKDAYAETFVKDEVFRERLNTKLPAASRLADPLVRPKAAQYSVIYAIATNKSLPGELPFFSKVTLKNAVRTLRALNYDVAMTRIPVNKTSKHRKNNP